MVGGPLPKCCPPKGSALKFTSIEDILNVFLTVVPGRGCFLRPTAQISEGSGLWTDLGASPIEGPLQLKQVPVQFLF